MGCFLNLLPQPAVLAPQVLPLPPHSQTSQHITLTIFCSVSSIPLRLLYLFLPTRCQQFVSSPRSFSLLLRSRHCACHRYLVEPAVGMNSMPAWLITLSREQYSGRNLNSIVCQMGSNAICPFCCSVHFRTKERNLLARSRQRMALFTALPA